MRKPAPVRARPTPVKGTAGTGWTGPERLYLSNKRAGAAVPAPRPAPPGGRFGVTLFPTVIS